MKRNITYSILLIISLVGLSTSAFKFKQVNEDLIVGKWKFENYIPSKITDKVKHEAYVKFQKENSSMIFNEDKSFLVSNGKQELKGTYKISSDGKQLLVTDEKTKTEKVKIIEFLSEDKCILAEKTKDGFNKSYIFKVK